MNMRLFCNALQDAYYTTKAHVATFLGLVGFFAVCNYMFFVRKVDALVAGNTELVQTFVMLEGLSMLVMQTLFIYMIVAAVLFKGHDIARFVWAYLRIALLGFFAALPAMVGIGISVYLLYVHAQAFWMPYAIGLVALVLSVLAYCYLPRILYSGSVLLDKNCTIGQALCYAHALTYQRRLYWNLFFASMFTVAIVIVLFVAPAVGYKFGFWWGTSTQSNFALALRLFLGILYFAGICALQYFAMMFHFMLYLRVRNNHEQTYGSNVNQACPPSSCNTSSCDDDKNNDQCC